MALIHVLMESSFLKKTTSSAKHALRRQKLRRMKVVPWLEMRPKRHVALSTNQSLRYITTTEILVLTSPCTGLILVRTSICYLTRFFFIFYFAVTQNYFDQNGQINFFKLKSTIKSCFFHSISL